MTVDSRPQSVPTRAARQTASGPVPNGPLAALAAAIAAVACFMPWLRVDLAAIPAAVNASFREATGATMPGMEGATAAVNSMLSSGGIAGTVTAAGIDGWVGILALFALALAATLHLAESVAASPQSRSMMLVGALLFAVVGGCCALYTLTQLGGPVGIHVGLVITTAGALAAAGLSVTRLQANAARAA